MVEVRSSWLDGESKSSHYLVHFDPPWGRESRRNAGVSFLVRVRAGSGAGRQESGAASGTGAERLHGAAGNRERRQADAVWIIQLAVSRGQCEDPAGAMERLPRLTL
jgi:hypothetical protein